ncbi:MAG: hypothetical protein K2L81_04725 [Muribaculaceae bacterium]|nr:hypothetical protein [Muribaculaceae bacterium]
MAINRAPQPIKGRPWILLVILLMTLLLMLRLRQCSAEDHAQHTLSDESVPADSTSVSSATGKNVEFVEFL